MRFRQVEKELPKTDSRIMEEVAMASGRPLTRSERIGSKIDAAIAMVAPRFALKRQLARARQHLFSSVFATGRGSRLHDDWTPIQVSFSAGVLDQLDDLRTRSRDLVAKDGHAEALVTTLVDNVVGTGIAPQARATSEETGLSEEAAEAWNRQCEQIWRDWAEREADATGHGTFYEIQQQAYEHLVVDGEAIVHPIGIPEGEIPGRLTGIAIELIEPERLDDPQGVRLPEFASSRLRRGIEIGAKGQPIAYWIADGNPLDRYRYPKVSWKRMRRWRDGQQQVMHIFRRRRAGQLRGYPRLAPVLLDFRTLSKYLEAELTTARVSACISAFIRRAGLGEELPPSFDLDPTAGSEGPRFLERLEPGTIEYLEPGEDIQQFAPLRPGNTFDAFVTRMLRAIAAAMGLPYELLVRDFSRTNYSSMRAALLETRRHFRREQALLNRSLNQPIYERLLDDAYVNGRLPRVARFNERRRALYRARWVAPPWGWVDPVKEIDAATASIRGNLSSLADEAAQAGQGWEDVAIARARELQRLMELEEKYGLERGSLTGDIRSGSAPAAAPMADEGDDAPDENDENDENEADGEPEDQNEDE